MIIIPNKNDIVRTLQIITRKDAGAIVEIRLIPKRKQDRIVSGYFDANSFSKVPDLLESILNRGKHTAYVTLNKLHDGLLARYCRRFEEAPERTTTDGEIMSYRWLFIDCDPIRPAGINATDIELQSAITMAELVKQYCLEVLELSSPIEALSGNGTHLLFPIDWPATKENAEIIKNILKELAEKFNSNTCKIDTVTFNPARVTKLYGTVAGKGDGLPERPARLSYIKVVPCDT